MNKLNLIIGTIAAICIIGAILEFSVIVGLIVAGVHFIQKFW